MGIWESWAFDGPGITEAGGISGGFTASGSEGVCCGTSAPWSAMVFLLFPQTAPIVEAISNPATQRESEGCRS